MGGPGGSKNQQKIEKNAFGRCLGPLIDVGSDLGAIFGDFGWILDGFWKDFGKIFEAYWKDLGDGSMIRATKGKSMYVCMYVCMYE